MYFASNILNMNTTNSFGILLSFALFCVSCTSKGNDNFLVGTWSYHQMIVNENAMSSKELGSPVVDFKKDGSYLLTFGMLADSGTWNIQGDTVFTTVNSKNIEQSMAIVKFSKDTMRFVRTSEDMNMELTMIPYKEKE